MPLNLNTEDSTISACENVNGKLDDNSIFKGPMGVGVLIHNKPSRRRTWDMRGIDGWSIEVKLECYRCQKVVAKYF